MRFTYSKEHLAFLQEGYKNLQISELAQAFNERFGMDKTEDQIKGTLNNHGFRAGRGSGVRPGVYQIVNPEQVEWIRTHYVDMPIKELTAVFNKVHGLELKVGQLKAFVKNHGISCGRTGRFNPGNKSWNEGTKGLTSANKTSFKKGNVSANIRPIGAERTCSKEGYILVKVDEPNPYTAAQTRFRHKHIVNWEAVHGPVKPGNVIKFLDGDKTNCDISNLIEISRAESCWLNKSGYSDLPAELKVPFRALGKLILATKAAEKLRRESA